jgi:hypothetical protein
MSDAELAEEFREWLLRRHPDRQPTLQLPVEGHISTLDALDAAWFHVAPAGVSLAASVDVPSRSTLATSLRRMSEARDTGR